jgi:hypothetical protein
MLREREREKGRKGRERKVGEDKGEGKVKRKVK